MKFAVAQTQPIKGDIAVNIENKGLLIWDEKTDFIKLLKNTEGYEM